MSDELKAAIEDLEQACEDRISLDREWIVPVRLTKLRTILDALQSPATIPGVQEMLRMERERCAKVADEVFFAAANDMEGASMDVFAVAEGASSAAHSIAKRIRNLGDAQ